MSDFRKDKGERGAVTVTRKKGPYDNEDDSRTLDFFRNMEGDIYGKDSNKDKVRSSKSSLKIIKDVVSDRKSSKGRKDHPFFKVTTGKI